MNAAIGLDDYVYLNSKVVMGISGFTQFGLKATTRKVRGLHSPPAGGEARMMQEFVDQINKSARKRDGGYATRPCR